MNYSINVSVHERYCEIPELISKTFGYWIMLYLGLTLSLTSICMNATLLTLIAKNSTFHLNLRILLIQMSVCFIWSASGYGVKAIYTLVVMSINPCNLITDAFMCKLQEALSTSLPVTITNYSLVVIGVERFYATIKFRTYETSKNFLPIIFLMTPLWIGVLCQQLIPLLSMAPNSKKMMPVCSNLLSLDSPTAKFVAGLNFVNEAVALALHLIILRINKLKLSTVYINQAQENLTARFQLDQNFKAIRTILPIVFAHIICWIPKGVCLGLAFFTNIINPGVDELCVVQVVTIVNIIFGNSYALITFVRNPLIRQGVKKLMPKFYKFIEFVLCRNRSRLFKFKVDIDGSLSETKKHFEMLENMWGRPKIERINSDYTIERN